METLLWARHHVRQHPDQVQVWRFLFPRQCKTYEERVRHVHMQFHHKTKHPLPDLAELTQTHYQRYSLDHWNAYLRDWIPEAHCMYLAVVYQDVRPIVTGFALCVANMYGKKECYVRLLCSACKCGRILMRALMQDATRDGQRRMALHSEPSCVGFYQRLHFVMVSSQYETNDMGTRYPFMILPLKPHTLKEVLEGRTVCTMFWFGWWYYLTNGWWWLALGASVLYGCWKFSHGIV